MPSTTSTRPEGHAVPDALARYYDALDAWRLDEVPEAFSADLLYAVPYAGRPETDPRRTVEGRPDLRAYLEERGPVPRAHDIQLCLVDERHVLVEGVARDTTTGAAEMAFVASVSLAGDGAVDRYLAFAGPVTGAPSAGEAAGSGAPDGPAPLAVLGAYFDALDRGAFAEAAACFADDVTYVHPPYRHTGIDGDERVTFLGRAALEEAFVARGRQEFGHRLVAAAQDGRHALVEGIVEGLPDGGTGSFVSSLTLGPAGTIARYVSYYCEPAVRPTG